MTTEFAEDCPGDRREDRKVPRTERGRKTLRKLLDAAATEFGERGFHEASISGITRRAGVALGTFYTYFDTKDGIFRALVNDMSEAVRQAAGAAIDPEMRPLEIERAALAAFLSFAAENKEIYRIIDEAEFVDPASYKEHYEVTAGRIVARLKGGVQAGDYRDGVGEIEAWAVMGMNVFLGLRYAIWSKPDDPDRGAVAQAANTLIARGLGAEN